MQNFIGWLKEHPALALGLGLVLAFLAIRSLLAKKDTGLGSPGGSSGGTGAQGDLAGGQVVSAGGYTFVPTGSSQSSTTLSGDVNPSAGQDLQALTGFLQAFQQGGSTTGSNTPPAAPAPAPAPAPTPAPAPAPTPINVTVQSSAQSSSQSRPGGWGLFPYLYSYGYPYAYGIHNWQNQATNTTASSSATVGTPPQVPGAPIVAGDPTNPNPLPPTRMWPVMHSVQGANHPIAGPIGF